MFTTIKADHFVMYERKDSKMKIKDFVLWCLNYHMKKYGVYPKRIVMNRKEISFLENNRGIIYQKHKIPVDTAKNCLPFDIWLM